MLEERLKLERARRPLDQSAVTWLLTGNDDRRYAIATQVMETLHAQGDQQLLEYAFCVAAENSDDSGHFIWHLLELNPPDTQLAQLLSRIDDRSFASIVRTVSWRSLDIWRRMLPICDRRQIFAALASDTHNCTLAQYVCEALVAKQNLSDGLTTGYGCNSTFIGAMRNVDVAWYAALSSVSATTTNQARTAAVEVAFGLLDSQQRRRVRDGIAAITDRPTIGQIIWRMVCPEAADQTALLAGMDPQQLADTLCAMNARYDTLDTFLAGQGAEYNADLLSSILGRNRRVEDYDMGVAIAMWLVDNTPYRRELLTRLLADSTLSSAAGCICSGLDLTDDDLDQLPLPLINRLGSLGAGVDSAALYGRIDGALEGKTDELAALLGSWQGTVGELTGAIITART